jgi:hypothetical protein
MISSNAPSPEAARVVPIADLHSFLAGAWQLERVIDDARLRRAGAMTGSVVFVADGALLRYRETGELRFGPYSGAASQTYLYRFIAPSCAEVLLADGRFFHRLDLSTGSTTVTHRCAADLYQAQFAVVSPDEWGVTWQIDGPRKRQRIATRLRRLPAATPSEGPPKPCV